MQKKKPKKNGTSLYREDPKRPEKTRKDPKRPEKTRKDALIYTEKTRKDALIYTEKTRKDPRRPEKTRKDPKRHPKRPKKTRKDTQHCLQIIVLINSVQSLESYKEKPLYRMKIVQ